MSWWKFSVKSVTEDRAMGEVTIPLTAQEDCSLRPCPWTTGLVGGRRPGRSSTPQPACCMAAKRTLFIPQHAVAIAAGRTL